MVYSPHTLQLQRRKCPALLLICLLFMMPFSNFVMVVSSFRVGRCTSEKGGRETDNNKVLLKVAIAAFIVSLRTQQKLEISVHLVENVIASPWIGPKELKHKLAALYNVGVNLYRNKELKKACEALKLCSKASWRCVELDCQLFVNQSSSSDNHQSEEAIMNFVGETCNRSAFYLHVLRQCSKCKIRQTVVHILEDWLSAEHLMRRLLGPTAIVKQWAKTNLDAVDSCTTLYSLLSPSKKKSNRAIGKILEQVGILIIFQLLVGSFWPIDEMFPLSSKLGQQTRVEIADILLKDVYVTKDMHIERARILVWKTKMTMASGIEDRADCIRSLSEAFSILGCTDLHHHIFELIFRLFKWRHVKLELCLAMMWECRRLSHALCPSPISDAFILSLSENFGDKSTCIDFWIDCLKDSKARLIGFQQNFHDLHNDFLLSSKKNKDPFHSDTTIDDITDAASELISSASPSGQSSFVAAYLYHDLSERLISFGKLSEALSYAKEAYRIRTLLFQDKFKYTAEKQFEKYNDAGKMSGIRSYSITDFQVYRSLATDFWPCGNFSWDINRCYLSRWNVLHCYLESTLQVGIVNELIGNGLEAESLLSWGKAISCSQSLFPFVVAFSSALGNFYNKKQSLDLAVKEIQNAKEILVTNQQKFSCVKCKLKLEVTLDKQLGDISRKQIDIVSQADGLLYAESLFSAALGKICCSAWKSCIRSHGEDIADARLIQMEVRERGWIACIFQCTEATCSSCMVPEELDLPRLAPERTQDLVQFAKEFFNNLPSSTIICISLLGGALNQLLQELMQIRSPVCAWVLISRLTLKSQPVATLLPVDSVLEDMSDDDGANTSSTEATQVKNLERRWLCPWGSTVVDDVAPAFKSIMEETHTSTGSSVEDTREHRNLWWKREKNLIIILKNS
ncbi:Separase [Raphanus sativus]|nr:Separase [Raphanus sativus]